VQGFFSYISFDRYSREYQNFPNNPVTMFKRGIKADAERKAAHYRMLLKLRDYDPMPSRKLAELLKITILTPNDIPGIDEETK
jgi:hypothetical protein